jgi:hypothetical protein
MQPSSIVAATNNYWIDFGTLFGGPMYGSILATNQYTCLFGLTNCARGKMFSINVDPSGANTTVLFPTNLFPHLNTNGLSTLGSFYSITITNGNEFRLSLQSNWTTLSSTWATFGQ